MVRIGGSTPTGEHIKEHDYYTPAGEFRVDKEGSPTLLNCLMYKMCYYRFGQVYTEQGKPTGYDRVRNVEIGNKVYFFIFFWDLNISFRILSWMFWRRPIPLSIGLCAFIR